MTAAEVMAAFAEPFDPSEVKWKPQSVKGNRALAIAYVDARVIMDRLDEVLGVGGWQDEYVTLEGGSVVCHLRCLIDGGWITKHDVGSQSEQPDDGDKVKAAFSDALKRAAVKFGMGRYLYRLSHQWVDYDPNKRQFVGTPKLPAWATPKADKPAEPVKDRQLTEHEVHEIIEEAKAKGITEAQLETGAKVKSLYDLTLSAGKKLLDRVKRATSEKKEAASATS